MRTGVLVAASVVSLVWLEGVAGAVELKNDGFVDGAPVSFQGGFAIGEIGASRFTPPSPGVQLLGVQFLFGGSPGTRDVTLHVWDDSAGQDDPVVEIFSGDYTVNAADDAMQSVDLSGDNVTVSGTFRVGIEFQHSGYPSIATDEDGTIAADKNYIYACTDPPDCLSYVWIRSAMIPMLDGDWIIRAEVSSDGSGSGGGSGTGTGTGTGTGSGSGGSGSGGPPWECRGSDECPIGQYCTDYGICTYDCRTDVDCPAGNRCNSLGACVTASLGDAPGDEGGCRTSPSGSAGVAGALLAGLAALSAALRRRRG